MIKRTKINENVEVKVIPSSGASLFFMNMLFLLKVKNIIVAET